MSARIGSRPRTIYRACPCRETAHDLRLLNLRPQTPPAADPGAEVPEAARWVWVYACRNCSSRARNRAGAVIEVS